MNELSGNYFLGIIVLLYFALLVTLPLAVAFITRSSYS